MQTAPTGYLQLMSKIWKVTLRVVQLAFTNFTSKSGKNCAKCRICIGSLRRRLGPPSVGICQLAPRKASEFNFVSYLPLK